MMPSYEYVRETRADRRLDYDCKIDAVDVQKANPSKLNRISVIASGAVNSKAALSVVNQFVNPSKFSRAHVVMQKALHSEVGAAWVAFAQSLNEHLQGRESAKPDPDFVQRLDMRTDRRPLFAALEKLSRLKADWAGPGSVPPPTPVMDAASSFARLLQPSIFSPQVTASADGDVAFVWLMPGRKIEVLIDVDLVLAWVVKIPPRRASDAVSWNGVIPTALHDWLRNVHT